jgi:hypothetical protein
MDFRSGKDADCGLLAYTVEMTCILKMETEIRGFHSSGYQVCLGWDTMSFGT